MSHALSFIDPAELARIGDLSLLARTVVAGSAGGLHKSARLGGSAEFKQYRPYAQGDDTRFIDWRLFGRTDRLHVKQFQEETNLRCMILLDCSGSMDYASGEVTKFRYAQMLAACLAMLLEQQRDTAGFIGYHAKLEAMVPARRHPHQLRTILTSIAGLPSAGATDTAAALQYIGDILPPRGMVVLISDLLHPLEGMLEHLRTLRARRHDMLVLQVSDPAEQTFPFEQSITLVDRESGREQFAIPSGVREQYLENRTRHFDAIRRACLASEIDIEEFTTSEPLDRALHHFMRKRHHALMTSNPRSAGSGSGR